MEDWRPPRACRSNLCRAYRPLAGNHPPELFAIIN